MRVRYLFDQFSIDEFCRCLRDLMKQDGFRYIRFAPDKRQLFTEEQLTHAAPHHDLTHEDSFLRAIVNHSRVDLCRSLSSKSLSEGVRVFSDMGLRPQVWQF